MTSDLFDRFARSVPGAEHALLASSVADLRHFRDHPFTRLYFGSEFCRWLLPGSAQVQAALEFCRDQAVPLTFVTPFLTEAGLRRVWELLDLLPRGAEVVVNDWGLLQAVVEHGLVPVAGRLLLKIKRDPRIAAEDLADGEFRHYLRSSNLGQPAFRAFLLSKGIARAELDNVQQGWDLHLDAAFRTTLYYPYVLASVTRRCSLLFDPENSFDGEELCSRGCRGIVLQTQAVVRQEGRDLPTDYLVQGGSLVFENRSPPGDTAGWNLDRLVFLPEMQTSCLPLAMDLVEAWDAAYRRYGAAVAWGFGEPDQFLLRMLDAHVRSLPERAKALDVGCGNGRNAVALVQRGMRVTAFDASPAALKQLRDRAPEIETVLGDARALPFDEEDFDLVVDCGCLHAISPADRIGYLAGVTKALRPGGLYCVCVRERPYGRPPDEPDLVVHGLLPEWGFTREDIQSFFGPPFRLIEWTLQHGADNEWFHRLVLCKETAARAGEKPDATTSNGRPAHAAKIGPR